MYNFDEIIDRRNTGSLKWDVAENELPMWVADMDFQTAPPILEALKKRVDHGIFGYSILPEEWNLAYVNWWKNRHGLAMEADWLIFTTGVIPGLSTAVRRFTAPAEKVVIQTPVYNMFYNSVLNNGRKILENTLAYENGEYHMDFVDLEAKLSDPQTSLMILCNPHNPVGKIWDRETLAKVGDLCKKHHVTVISDEIHCDITDPGKGYVPFASVNETCADISISLIAPTKCFNIAGIQTAAAFSKNPSLRHKMWRALNTDEVAEPNAFAVTATIAAFNEGGPWLDELRQYIYDNKQLVIETLAREIPEIHVVPSDATYLLWLDCSKLTEDAEVLAKNIREKTGLYMTAGSHYGACGRSFIRWNIACPRALVLDGLERLQNGILK